MTSQSIGLSNAEYWFKAEDMLQQNWGIIEFEEKEVGCTVYFISATSGVFDQIRFENLSEAERQLRMNGFAKFEEDEEAKKFIAPPVPPFHQSSQPSEAIYSSGRYWKTN